MAKRKPLSKKTRFEVFKRDSFTCQYCGSKAHNVVLHVDHIAPVSKGGSNDLLNLVTSCDACNSGKSDRALDDASVVSKRMTQAKALQERRDQIEMIADWQRGLVDLDSAQYKEAADYFSRLTGGWSLDNNISGPQLRASLNKHGLTEVMSCMRAKAAVHLRIGANGKATQESAEILCRVFFDALRYKDENERDPVGSGARYAAGIARNRLPYVPWDHREIFIEWARYGVPVDALKGCASTAYCWSQLFDQIESYIEVHHAG